MNTNFFIDSFLSIFEKGGFVLILIFIQFLVMWYFACLKYLYFKYDFKNDFQDFKVQLKTIESDNLGFESQRIERHVSLLKQKMKSNLSLLQLMVMLAPLFGLLGTVTGMITVFDVMAVAGSGNARAMASGISKATIPTMAGMVGALTGLFFMNYLKGEIKTKSTQISDYINNWVLNISDSEI
jgi:biopolymer transport protein ExbB